MPQCGDSLSPGAALAGRWGDGGPSYQVRTGRITILPGLQHDSVAVRANHENLFKHAGDRTRDMYSLRGDQTAARGS